MFINPKTIARMRRYGCKLVEFKMPGEPLSKAGDYVILRATMDCIVAMSACPQDILPINKGRPVEAHYRILGG